MGTTISSAIPFTTGLVRIIFCRYLYIIPPGLPSLEIWHGHLIIPLHQLTTKESAPQQGIGSSTEQTRHLYTHTQQLVQLRPAPQDNLCAILRPAPRGSSLLESACLAWVRID